MNWILALFLLQTAELNTTEIDTNASIVTPAYLGELLERLRTDGKREGEALFAVGDYAGALAAFTEALALDESDAELNAHVAFTYHRLGNAERSERHYRRALELAKQPLAVWVGLADLLIEGGTSTHLARAAKVLERGREVWGNMHALILRQARVAARRGDVDGAEKFYAQALKAADIDPEGVRQTNLELGDLYRDVGRPLDALSLYRQIDGPDASARTQELDISMQARRYGWGSGTPSTDRLRGLYSKARAFVQQHRYKEASAVLGELQQLDPTYAAAWLLSGEVALAQGQTQDAELAYLRALAMDQGSVEAHEQLAARYRADKRSAEAVLLLERALQLAPEQRPLRLQLALAQRDNGNLVEALAAVESYLADPPVGAPTLQAQLLRAALRAAVEAPDAVAVEAAASDLPQRVQRIRALLARGATDAAMAELDAVIAAQPSPALLNLRARILRGAGHQEAAQAAYAASLALDPDQASVHVELGQLAEAQAQLAAAKEHYAAATRLGDDAAAFFLTRLRARKAQQQGVAAWRAMARSRQELAAFLTKHADGDLAAEARVLLDDIDRLLARLVATGAAASFAFFLAFGWWSWRRWGGATLSGLLVRAPDVVPDVQRLVSAIRHEILKHNALAVSGLVAALERGEGTGAQGAHVAATVGDAEVQAQLRAYLDKLVQVARAAGIRLNVRREPAFVALWQGLAEVQRLRPQLPRIERMLGHRRRLLARRLRRAHALLSDGSFRRLEEMLRRVHVLVIDESLLRNVHARICREPALLTLMPLPLRLEVEQGLPCALALRRRDFDDLLGNLLRNALQASARDAVPPRVGLRVSSESHPVTGLDDLVLQVCDDAGDLPEETLAQAEVSSGLGLARELVRRYDGRIEVMRSVPGWRKAVVVRLPRQEVAA